MRREDERQMGLGRCDVSATLGAEFAEFTKSPRALYRHA